MKYKCPAPVANLDRDLVVPSANSARLRATGAITTDMKHTTIRFGDVEFTVGLELRKFPQGGSWSFFICPQCNKRSKVLRLLEGQPACTYCCAKQGVRYRYELMGLADRAAIRAPKLREQLNSDKPARLHRLLDRRPGL